MSIDLVKNGYLLMASSCEDYSQAQEINCNVSGYFCYKTDFKDLNISFGVYHTTRSCYNVTTSELCPRGYYCPTTTELNVCPVGSFCGAGSTKAFPCLFGSATCSQPQLSAASGGIMFLIFLGILSAMLSIIYYSAKWKILRSQNKLKLSKVEKKQLKETKTVRLIDVDASMVLQSLESHRSQNLLKTRSVWDSLMAQHSDRDDNSSKAATFGGNHADEDDNYGFAFVADSTGKELDEDEEMSAGNIRIRAAKRSFHNQSKGDFKSFRTRAKENDSTNSSGEHSLGNTSARQVNFNVADEEDQKLPSARSSHSLSSRTSSRYRLGNASSYFSSLPPQDSARSSASVSSLNSDGSSPSDASVMKRYNTFVEALKKQPTDAEIAKLKGKAKLRAIINSKKFQQYKKQWKKNKGNNNFAFHYHSTFKPRKIENPVHVSFDKLKLVLKSDHNSVLLDDIFGTIRPFHITALMGPSGSGKTTLLNMLRGVAHYATAEGIIFVNRVATTSLAAYRDEMAFVPQDDILYEELTVEENVAFSAILFNRRGYTSREQVAPMVRHALLSTGLAVDGDEDSNVPQLRHAVVGGADKKGISGGQKKRVSIAMEMMKEASMFFLDEPTSGLDSATSMAVLSALSQLKDTGVNIVATLHQPRKEILSAIQCLLLLVPGGKLAFFDSPLELYHHLSDCGFICQPNKNIADFVMDLIAGFVPRNGHERVAATDICEELVYKWASQRYVPYLRYLRNEEQSIAMWNNRNENLDIAYIDNSHVKSSLERHKKRSLRSQLYLFLYGFNKTFYVSWLRQEKVLERTTSTVIYNAFVLMVFGALMALLFGSMSLTSLSTGAALTQIVSSHLTFSLFILTNQIRLFSFDSEIRLREENGGLLILPWYLGKVLAGYVDIILSPLAFVFGYYSFVQSRTTFLHYWATYVLIYLSISGLANFCACMFSGKSRNSIASGLLVVLWCFGGIAPSFDAIERRLSALGILLYYCSPFRWSLQINTLMEFSTYSDAYGSTIQDTYDSLGYNEDDYESCAIALIIYWLVTNALALTMLLIRRDDYKLLRIILYRIDTILFHHKKKESGGIAVSKRGVATKPAARDLKSNPSAQPSVELSLKVSSLRIASPSQPSALVFSASQSPNQPKAKDRNAVVIELPSREAAARLIDESDVETASSFGKPLSLPPLPPQKTKSPVPKLNLSGNSIRNLADEENKHPDRSLGRGRGKGRGRGRGRGRERGTSEENSDALPRRNRPVHITLPVETFSP